jgi:hypothetical protein
MPQRNSSRRVILRLVLFTLAGWLLWALGRDSDGRRGPAPEIATTATEGPKPTRERAKTSGFSKRRLATTLAFTTLLFGGAAFSGVAGELFVNPARGADCTTETTSDDAEPASETTEPGASPAPEESCDASSSAETPTVDGTSSEESPAAAPAPTTNEEGETGNTGTNTNADGSTGSQAQNQSGGDQSGDDGSGADGSEGSVPDPILGDDGSDDASGGADQSDEPDAGPGSPQHAGDEQSSNDVGLTSEDNSAADLEFDNEEGYGVVWLHRTLPDPTPPASRLSPRFARLLADESSANHVDWALVLGVLRASGHKSSSPATQRQLHSLASTLRELHANADEWRAALALKGRTLFADRAVALARYNRAVGLRGLVRGLQAETPALEQRVLNDSRLSIYQGGRDDVANHRINVRVLVLVLYMAEAHGSVTVSSLNSGHRLYSRPGVVSAHKYGLAVDIAALGGESILGHQQAGSLTERAVRNILLLPVEVRPRQVISLLGLGGPSFPLADHYDHIHVGY